MIAISDRPCWLAEACKILLLFVLAEPWPTQLFTASSPFSFKQRDR